MSKLKKHRKPDDARAHMDPGAVATEEGPLRSKEYDRERRKLHFELVKLQEWVRHKGKKICIVFEGRDSAGKCGTIKAITERVSPRIFHVMALSASTEREKSQMYIQRYVPHLPAAGEVVIFDRSWYNRADVERVMDSAPTSRLRDFSKRCPGVERAIIDSGMILLKYWLEVNPEEQTRRLEARIDDGRKIWKLSARDLEFYRRWDDYFCARDEMFMATFDQGPPCDDKHPRTESSPSPSVVGELRQYVGSRVCIPGFRPLLDEWKHNVVAPDYIVVAGCSDRELTFRQSHRLRGPSGNLGIPLNQNGRERTRLRTPCSAAQSSPLSSFC